MEIMNPPLGNAGALKPLSRLVEQYDGILCDVWGVVHNGVAAFESAVDALCKFRASGRLVILITNAPRLSKEIYPQLHRLGVPRTHSDVADSTLALHLIQRRQDLIVSNHPTADQQDRGLHFFPITAR